MLDARKLSIGALFLLVLFGRAAGGDDRELLGRDGTALLDRRNRDPEIVEIQHRFDDLLQLRFRLPAVDSGDQKGVGLLRMALGTGQVLPGGEDIQR